MNPALQIRPSSARAHKARFAVRFGKSGVFFLTIIAAFSGVAALYLMLLVKTNLAYLLWAIMLFALMYIVWYKAELQKIPSRLPMGRIDDVLDQSLLAKLKDPITPRSVWMALTGNWHEIFITNRLLLNPTMVRDSLSENPTDMEPIWENALRLQSTVPGSDGLSAGAVATALIASSKPVQDFLTQQKLQPDDILQCYDWLARLISYESVPRPYFGGIGRDWAFGFTPMLEQFTTNISAGAQAGAGHFHFLSRSSSIDALINSLDQSGGVALVGNTGIGKTAMVHALAERLLSDQTTESLRHHQIVMLNASVILSSAKDNLEQVMLTLFTEAVTSGNMVLFLDEAQLFFQEGTGAFDLSRILLPVLQNRRLKIITAWNSSDFQRLKSSNSALAAYLTPIVLNEPPQADTFKIAEDSSLTIELRTKTIISYEAVREAVRLSGQYMQQLAYPGKAIQLLEQSTSYADHHVVDAKAVRQTVEQTLGVKVGGVEVGGQEADVLLNLEDRIHERMVNQSQAVKVVANALRRARAGVGNTKRPIGSFLFMGPTGVGKTELARSLAAIYFGDERNMIRLDMSEYQQPESVGRLLDGGQNGEGLLLAIRKQPFSVVLLDEIEKAYSGVLNLLLQLLDEGQLTDVNGQPASFRNAIIIITSNAGSKDIIHRIENNQPLTDFERPLINQLIEQGVFRAELINRFDEIVLFRPLNQSELGQVAQLMLAEVNRTLSIQNISVEVTPAALQSLVQQGYDPEFGSRPMRRVIQRTVEDVVAKRILQGQAAPGTKLLLDLPDLVPDSDSADNSVVEPSKEPFVQPPNTLQPPTAS